MAAPMRSTSAARSDRRAPAGRTTSTAPALTVIPGVRRRWPVLFGAVALLVVLAGLMGAAVFHTQLAERQIRIDELERAVKDERERFDELRYQRAELRSPVRLASAAEELGMVPGDTGTFAEIDPWLLARQLAAAGVVDHTETVIVIDTDPLEQFSDVKRVSAGQP